MQRRREESYGASVTRRRMFHTPLPYVLLLTSLAVSLSAQRPTFEQQMRDNQRRLEDIRRERSAVEQEKDATNRIVNELDRQIAALSRQIDETTVNLLLAQDALAEKRAVLERRLVDIYKRGPLYGYQVLLAAESFGDLLSRYKYLFLVSRQDRLLTNDMIKLKNRIARERQVLVDTRDALGRRKTERTQELDRFVTLARERESRLRATRRSLQEAQQRLTAAGHEERRITDLIASLERARREAEARGAAPGAAAITTASLGQLDWPVDGRLLYQFGPAAGPGNTRITWHGIGIGAPAGTPVRAVAAGTVALVGNMGTYLTSVIVDHGGGYYTFYAYLDDAAVTKGERVLKSQVIGHVGGAASDQGPHLHFELRGQGGIALDPLNWLDRKSTRLNSSHVEI